MWTAVSFFKYRLQSNVLKQQYVGIFGCIAIKYGHGLDYRRRFALTFVGAPPGDEAEHHSGGRHTQTDALLRHHEADAEEEVVAPHVVVDVSRRGQQGDVTDARPEVVLLVLFFNRRDLVFRAFSRRRRRRRRRRRGLPGIFDSDGGTHSSSTVTYVVFGYS